jgi:hypothetical protein
LGTPPDPDDISIRWHKSYYATYLNGDQQLDRIFDNIVEKELPWTRLTSESVVDFRTDLPVGTCMLEHKKEYFESTLPSNPPKIHPGSIWSTYGPYSQKTSPWMRKKAFPMDQGPFQIKAKESVRP